MRVGIDRHAQLHARRRLGRQRRRRRGPRPAESQRARSGRQHPTEVLVDGASETSRGRCRRPEQVIAPPSGQQIIDVIARHDPRTPRSDRCEGGRMGGEGPGYGTARGGDLRAAPAHHAHAGAEAPVEAHDRRAVVAVLDRHRHRGGTCVPHRGAQLDGCRRPGNDAGRSRIDNPRGRHQPVRGARPRLVRCLTLHVIGGSAQLHGGASQRRAKCCLPRRPEPFGVAPAPPQRLDHSAELSVDAIECRGMAP